MDEFILNQRRLQMGQFGEQGTTQLERIHRDIWALQKHINRLDELLCLHNSYVTSSVEIILERLKEIKDEED